MTRPAPSFEEWLRRQGLALTKQQRQAVEDLGTGEPVATFPLRGGRTWLATKLAEYIESRYPGADA